MTELEYIEDEKNKLKELVDSAAKTNDLADWEWRELMDRAFYLDGLKPIVEAIDKLNENCAQLNAECECRGSDCDSCYITTAINALEKQIKKKPTERVEGKELGLAHDKHPYWVCPACGKPVEIDDAEEYLTELVDSCKCGQRIDWFGYALWKEEWIE